MIYFSTKKRSSSDLKINNFLSHVSNGDTQLILKNTRVLKNSNNKNQFLFWLTEMPLIKNINIQSYYKNLFNCYITHFLSIENLNYLKSDCLEKDTFQSIIVALFTVIQTKNDKIQPPELYYAKISLAELSSVTFSAWDVFIKDVLDVLHRKHDLMNIKCVISFKLTIAFDSEIIEKSGFISGKLIRTEFDKHNNLKFFPE